MITKFDETQFVPKYARDGDQLPDDFYSNVLDTLNVQVTEEVMRNNITLTLNGKRC